jgi:cytidylate kinase
MSTDTTPAQAGDPAGRPEDRVAVPPVVTLFEYAGAGAGYVGREVADALGLPFHAQAFSSSQLEQGAASDPDAALEQNAALASVLSVMGGAYRGFEGRDVVTTQQEKYDLVADNNRTVHRFAKEGGVIVGRNATVILADRPRTLHVLLTGSVADRVARSAREAGISTEHAARRQQREDDVRAQMSQVLYGWDPRTPDRYDLVANTSRIPLDGVVAAVVQTVRALAG